jgi:hypothetical protein
MQAAGSLQSALSYLLRLIGLVSCLPAAQLELAPHQQLELAIPTQAGKLQALLPLLLLLLYGVA